MTVRANRHVLTQAAGLARRVHDSGTLKERFDNIVTAARVADHLEGAKTALDRRVPTRWNSDLDCLRAHVHFKPQVRQLIAQDEALDQYLMTPLQWDVAAEVAEVLVVRVHATCALSLHNE